MHGENEYKLPSKIRNERTYFVFQTDQNIEREGVLVSSAVVPPTLVSSAAAFFQTSPAAFLLSLRCHPSI